MIDDDFKRAQILLHEYNALRAEVVSRYAAQFQSGSVAFVVLVPIVAFTIQTHEYFLGGGLFLIDAICWALVLTWIDFDLKKLSASLKALEKQINGLAGGHQLLKWETEQGIGGVFAKRISR
jgi:hypothetical protein